MSKMDGLRAMREARYAEAAKRASAATPAQKKAAVTDVAAPDGATEPPATRKRPAAKRASTKGAAAKNAAASAPSDGDVEAVGDGAAEGSLCGHRAISGRTCTRERGHAAKSHRYA